MGRIFENVWLRNIIGFTALLVVYFVSDHYSLMQRTGWNKVSPYFFLLLMYGWIVLHNRLLFEKLFLRGKKPAYFAWTGTAMGLSSANMHYILTTGFNVDYTLPHILTFWVYTITGLGVFVMYKYLKRPEPIETKNQTPVGVESSDLTFISDGERYTLKHSDILYIESLENYVKIFSDKRVYIVRQSLKETEDKLPSSTFIRISRSHIINTSHLASTDGDNIVVKDRVFKIGKVYKKLVEQKLQTKLTR